MVLSSCFETRRRGTTRRDNVAWAGDEIYAAHLRAIRRDIGEEDRGHSVATVVRVIQSATYHTETSAWWTRTISL